MDTQKMKTQIKGAVIDALLSAALAFIQVFSTTFASKMIPAQNNPEEKTTHLL